MSWGVVEILEPVVEYHVVPMIDMGDNNMVSSAAHDCSPKCPCGPIMQLNNHGYPMYQHHDPEHDGAMSDREWFELKKRATTCQ